MFSYPTTPEDRVRMTTPPPSPVHRRTSMIEDSLRHSLELSLASTDFDPEDLELADVFLGSELRPTVAAGAPAMITVELDPDDLSYVFVNIDPPGEPLVASLGKDPRLTDSVGFDLRPAEALELGTR